MGAGFQLLIARVVVIAIPFGVKADDRVAQYRVDTLAMQIVKIQARGRFMRCVQYLPHDGIVILDEAVFTRVQFLVQVGLPSSCGPAEQRWWCLP